MEYLGINLTKYVQDLHEENYKTLVKEVKEELNKWRDIPYVHGQEDSILIVKMSVLPNLIYRSNAIPIKIPKSYFMDIDKLISKVHSYVDLKCILLSERSQSEKAGYATIPTIRYSGKDKTTETVKRSGVRSREGGYIGDTGLLGQ